MPAEAGFTPEQRIANLFAEHGEGAMDGDRGVEDRIADLAPDTPGRTAERAKQNKGVKEPGDPDSDEALAGEQAEDEDGSPESDTDDGTEGSQEEGIEAAALAGYLGIGEEEIAVDEEGRPLFTVKVDGESRDVDLSELRRGYSGQEVFTRKSQELAQQRQAFEQQQQQDREALILKGQTVDRVLADHQQEILNQYEREDWDKLRQENPSEFAAKRTEYAELYQKLERRRAGIAEEVTGLQQQLHQQFQQRHQEMSIAEGRELRSKVTEWKTDEQAAKGAQALQEFLIGTYGFSPEDIANTVNHRAYLVALDAMRYRAQQKEADPVRKRVLKTPRVLKPGVPSSEEGRKRTHTARVVKRHKQEKTVESAADAFLAKNII